MDIFNFTNFKEVVTDRLPKLPSTELLLRCLNHVHFFYFLNGWAFFAFGFYLITHYSNIEFLALKYYEDGTYLDILPMGIFFLAGGFVLTASSSRLSLPSQTSDSLQLLSVLTEGMSIVARVTVWAAVSIIAVAALQQLADSHHVTVVANNIGLVEAWARLYGYGLVAYVIFAGLWSIFCTARVILNRGNKKNE